MALLTLAIGFLLFAAGLGSLAMSVDLVPTEMGRLYVESGVAFLCASGIVFAIAALIARLDRIVAPRKPVAAPPEPAAVAEDDVNLNRSGHLPNLREMEEAFAEPEAPPEIIGRYRAGGVEYAVFSDGAIEAETPDGALRFGSMDDFKAHVAQLKA